MNLLCLDIGNTHTHYGRWAAEQIDCEGSFPTGDWESLPQLVRTTGAEALAYCSVVPAVNDDLEHQAKALGMGVYHLTAQNCSSLRIDYPKPHEIGEDRLANALGAQAFYGAPAVVIDMGTAVTFDILSPRGAYEGGIIAPGMAVMTRYLHEQTALLPQLDENLLLAPEGIGKSTLEAMRIGCVVGFSGMIRALLERVLAQWPNNANPTIIGTGGTAAALLKDVHPELRLDPLITLRGLSEAYQRQQKTLNPAS